MKLWLLTCADSYSVDMSTNRLSIFHVIENIGAASFPVTLPRLSFIVLLSRTSRETQKASVELRLTLNKVSLAKLNFDMLFRVS